ncbi:hypothetical protein RJ639_043782 [Escallonia herrerae]|uniref:RING-type E3 ubiquitin transferase n=1 Tax=Escallonia herrerae TaxID=1293975 RepID=A0AA88WCS8_9ASTE|nr:hypothetical protein RJ639_043782 [Escallonia herrerae]
MSNMSTSVGHLYSRRLLLHTPLYHQPASAPYPATGNSHYTSETYPSDDNSFDPNVVIIVSVVMCGLLCAVGLTSVASCVSRGSDSVDSGDAGDSHSARSADTGIKKEALETFPTLNTGVLGHRVRNLPVGVCSGESVRVLPKCGHGFHMVCIDEWLLSHCSCPTCRHCLIQTCQQIVGMNQPPPPLPPTTTQECIIGIVPLDRMFDA